MEPNAETDTQATRAVTAVPVRRLPLCLPLIVAVAATLTVGFAAALTAMAHGQTALALGCTAGGILAVCLGIAYDLGRRVVAPVAAVRVAMRRLGEGDVAALTEQVACAEVAHLAQTVAERGSKLRRLVRSEEERRRMQEQLMELLRIVTAASEGQLNRRATVTPDELGSLADAFNTMVSR
ncbi:MAG TPA: hypothetical protein DC005_00100, partial [Proteobacteria bacterium]|nr:hypothetical protein [Pseudomonadota bacterium]